MGRRKKPDRASADAAPNAPVASTRQPRHVIWWIGAAVLLAGSTLGAALLLWRLPPRTVEAARARLASLRPAPRDLSVVLVTVDTLRADRLGCYGFAGIETPAIDGLAKDGVTFDNETAAVPLTLPSHASLMTGLLPTRHGIHDNGGFFLAKEVTTLAERFHRDGYATGAFVGAWVLEGRWGLNQGFDRYADDFDLSKYRVISLGTVQKSGDEVMDGALQWIGGQTTKRFFAWIHLYDPHTPYDPPEPHRSRYPKDPYLGEVAYTDTVVGRLTTFLRERNLLGRTLVVLTSDHGESLGEHGEETHGFFLYDSTLRVPLVIRTPWDLRGRVRAQTTSIDLFPTILDLAGLPPEPGIDGVSMAPVLFDTARDPGRVAYSETYFPRYHYGWQHLRSLRDGRFKYIDAPTPELYDLTKDVTETSNVQKARSLRGEELRRILVAFPGVEGAKAPERQTLDPDTLQRLASLGYVGSVADSDPAAVLPDPKDKLPIFRLMNEAKDAAQKDRLEEAVVSMRSVLASDPGIVDGWTTLGNWLARLHRTVEAEAAFRRVLDIQPGNDVALLNLAHLNRAVGKNEAALEGYRAALRLDRGNAQARYQYATLLLDLGRRDEAAREFRTVLAQAPKMGASWNALGALAFQRGDLPEAERLVAKGLELEPKVRFGAFNMGRILEAKGESSRAAEAYRRELQLYPDHGKARFNLAQLLRESGDRPAFLAELRRSTEASPDFGPSFFFLAREELNAGRLDVAADLARRGLEADPSSDVAALGHFVLADVLSRRGLRAEAETEAARGRPSRQ